jgi:hypothetical protein
MDKQAFPDKVENTQTLLWWQRLCRSCTVEGI